MLLGAAANDGAVDAQPGFDVFLGEILEELLQIANDAALETFDQLATFFGDANQNLATILRMAEALDETSFDEAFDQSGGGWCGVAHELGELGHVQARGLVEKSEQSVLGDRDVSAINFGRKFHKERPL